MVKHGNFKFVAFNVAQLIFTFASSLVLWPLISVDRFWAVYLHLRYQEHMTHKRVVAAVNSIWTLSVLYRGIKIVFDLEISEWSLFSKSVSLLQELLFTEFILLYEAIKTNCKPNKYK